MQLVGKRLACLTLLLLAAGGEGTAAAQGQPADVVADRFWASGKLDDGEKALSERLQRGEDDQVRFALGVTQFLRGVERLMQNLHSYGLKSQGGGGMIDLPVLRLPTPPNPDPKTLAYADARAVLEQWVTDLNAAEQTLARVKSADVKLPVRVGMIRLDFDGDGQAGDEETLWRIFARVQPRAGVNEANAAEFAIAFDAGDVAWLRGYCHLLAALGEVALAHDGQELFESTAHMFFQKVRSPHAYLQEGRKLADFGGDIDVADLIALVHLIRMPVTEPQRMQAALSHFQSVVAMSRESWKHILAEADNDREWVPNPSQKSVMSGLRVSQDMVDSWKTFLEECDDLLAGKRLAPFWRSNDRRGINIRRVFTEPTRLDLVLWVQGTAATPYLEEGELTRREVWNGIARAFGGDFLGFALWFN